MDTKDWLSTRGSKAAAWHTMCGRLGACLTFCRVCLELIMCECDCRQLARQDRCWTCMFCVVAGVCVLGEFSAAVRLLCCP